VGVRAGRLVLVGVVGLWFDRRFLRLRAGLRRIRWVAQFGGACLGRGGGRRSRWPRPRTGPSHCAHVKWAAGGRVWWAPKIKSRASGGRSATGGGAGLRCLPAVVACGRLRPGSLVAVVARRESSRPGGVQPDRCRCGAETPGWTPPVRNDCASTADSDEGSGTTPPVGRGPAPSGSHRHRRVCVPKWTPFTPQGWCPGSLVAVGGLCQPARTGWFPPGDDSDEGSGTKATTSNDCQQTTQPGPPPVAERPPEAPALHHGFDFDFQTSHRAAGRQREPATHHRTAPPADPS